MPLLNRLTFPLKKKEEDKLKTPNLVGMNLVLAVNICNNLNITYRISGLRPEWKPSKCFVVSQMPAAGTALRLKNKKDGPMIVLGVSNEAVM